MSFGWGTSANRTLKSSQAMPPLASSIVDAEGVATVQAWIESLDGCP
jgi:hypothetical protein